MASSIFFENFVGSGHGHGNRGLLLAPALVLCIDNVNVVDENELEGVDSVGGIVLYVGTDGSVEEQDDIVDGVDMDISSDVEDWACTLDTPRDCNWRLEIG